MIIEPIDPHKREWMKEARKSLGLKLKEVADILGISFQHYHDIENGRRNPSFELSMKLSKFYDVPIEKFFEDRTKFRHKEE